MSPEEFKIWFKKHKAKFNGLNEWFAAMPPEGSETLPGRSDTFEAWYRALSELPLSEALEASEAMFADSDLEPSAGFRQHPSTIIKIAAALRVRATPPKKVIVDGQETFKCRLCQDSGALTIYQSRTTRIASRREFREASGAERDTPVELEAPFSLNTECVACICDAGHYWRSRIKLPTYDPKLHCLELAEPMETTYQRLREFVSSQQDDRVEVPF